MIGGLEGFVVALRRSGIAVSPAEWLDGLRALKLVGIEDRERVRRALRCTLVKRASQRAVFDRTFDVFFSSAPRPARAGKQKGRAGASAGSKGKLPPGHGQAPTSARGAPRASVLQLVQDARAGSPSRSTRLRRVVLSNRDVRESGEAAQRDPARRDLRRSMSFDDEREVAALLPRIVERIRLRTGRRQRRSPRGRLHLRDTFRENLRYGGVPWKLPRRLVVPRRSKVVMLIDVSWSTARAAGLFLSMAGELSRRAAGTRVLLFVDKVVDATEPIERWLEGRATAAAASSEASQRLRPGAAVTRSGISFASVLAALGGLNLEAASDYGRTLSGLLRSPLRPAGRDTVLIVLGDGRSNRFDPQSWAFEEIAERCRAVLWLVPEGLERWGTGDSALGAYLPHVDVAVEARDLGGLALGVGELLRRL